MIHFSFFINLSFVFGFRGLLFSFGLGLVFVTIILILLSNFVASVQLFCIDFQDFETIVIYLWPFAEILSHFSHVSWSNFQFVGSGFTKLASDPQFDWSFFKFSRFLVWDFWSIPKVFVFGL